MGNMLEKPCMSVVIDRDASKQFTVGVAEVNGHRNNMEDAHLIHIEDGWAIFGVFDGHGGEQCSKWIAERLKKHLEKNGCPETDAAIKKLFLSVDKEFLDTGLPSGTTATMCIVRKLGSGRNRLTVINAGDSRVLLGKRDGTIVDGGGTDQGLTTDHKPDHPTERERIERCGGTVEIAMGGVSRLNGDLAVCRGFGDQNYKTQGPDRSDLENQPATANPEIGTFDCDDLDFVLLVCDGVSEGAFPNPEVVKLVAEQLKESENIGYAAQGVCERAVQMNSKDNVTCMIVLPKGPDNASEIKHSREFIPGPFFGDSNFLKAYEAMAERGGFTLVEAVEKRCEIIEEELNVPEKRDAAEAEKKRLGNPRGEKGSDERREWCVKWVLENKTNSSSGSQDRLMQQLLSLQGQTNQARQQTVRAPPLDVLKAGVTDHIALRWDEKMVQLAECEGSVLKVDDTDGTTHVKFEAHGISAWLPTDILEFLDES